MHWSMRAEGFELMLPGAKSVYASQAGLLLRWMASSDSESTLIQRPSLKRGLTSHRNLFKFAVLKQDVHRCYDRGSYT